MLEHRFKSHKIDDLGIDPMFSITNLRESPLVLVGHSQNIWFKLQNARMLGMTSCSKFITQLFTISNIKMSISIFKNDQEKTGQPSQDPSEKAHVWKPCPTPQRRQKGPKHGGIMWYNGFLQFYGFSYKANGCKWAIGFR